MQQGYWWSPLLWTPLCTAAIVWVMRRYAMGSAGSGIPQVMAALDASVSPANRSLFVSLKLTLAKMALATWGLLAGLSLGREGPSVQIAAGVMHHARRWLPDKSQVSEHGLMMAGGAAGIAAAFNTPLGGVMFAIEEYEAPWNSGKQLEGGNRGHRPTVKGGYFPVPPVDSTQDMRAEMSLILESLGIPVEVFHHEVAGAGQNEIGTKFSTLVQRADWTQVLKYVVWNVANAYGKTATFMPKPYAGDNGSGMHVHQSIWKDGKNLFAGDGYAGLSDFALYYIGGIIKHARALNAITNPGTNSYKRLVPGFEAPVKLAYSARNRSASIRIPHVANPKGRRIEARFPDPSSNPYLCFSALMMAGLDGVENKIHPGEAATKDLYHLPPEEDKLVPTVCHSLDQALDYLDKDRGFLT
ncbi:MAG: hypothetical protein GW928_04960, partial [Rhodoferax sp.]|nr:hypothetical protein [Rhodoferax sp.]